MERRKECIDPKASDADLWIKSWEELHLLLSKEILVEVDHVKAHRTQKEKKEMSHFERFVTEGNEKADELAKEGAMLDEWFMTKARAETAQQQKNKCMQPCSLQSSFIAWWKNGKIVKSRSQKKSGFSWISKERRRSIERSGVLRPPSINA